MYVYNTYVGISVWVLFGWASFIILINMSKNKSTAQIVHVVCHHVVVRRSTVDRPFARYFVGGLGPSLRRIVRRRPLDRSLARSFTPSVARRRSCSFTGILWLLLLLLLLLDLPISLCCGTAVSPRLPLSLTSPHAPSDTLAI